jgi:iron complex transport system ATP-binding protein
MLEANCLSCSVGRRPILQEIDFAIAANDFVLIFGANGAGKSTLLRTLAGLLPPSKGEIRLAGRSMDRYSRRELATRLSYLPQSDDFELPLLVADILQAGRYPYRSPFKGFSADDRRAIAAGVLEFGLDGLLQRNIQTLSGGERKKVLLASAFVQDVPLILLDEPLSFLDPGSAARLVGALDRLRRQGRTIVVVSHEVERFFPHANKILALKEGRQCYFGSRVFSPDLLREVYGVAFQSVRAGNKEHLFVDE